MRSAVNVQGLPQTIVPDNRHVIGVAKSIGEDIKEGVNKRRANKLVEEIMAAQNADVPQAVRAQAMPNLDQPQDPQAALQSQAVELQKQKQVQQAQVQAEQAQKAIVQRSNMQRMLNDPATKANLIKLQGLDPQMARTVFTMLASADEQERLQVAQEAQRANDMFQNAAYFLQQDIAKKGGGDQFKAFVADAIRQEHARGADTTKLQELYRANPDEAIGLIQRNLALSGTVLKMPEVERITALEQAKLDDADADRALKAREVAVKERNQTLQEQQAQNKPDKAQVKAEAKRQEDLKAYELYQVGMGNLKQAFTEINSGPISGRIWGAAGDHQTAQGMRDQMAPILKKMFRESGEGTFTEGDRIALMAMLPETTDSEEAVAAKITAMDQIVKSKLGIESQSFGAVGGTLPQGVTEADIQHTMQKHGVSREEVLQRLGGQ